MRCSIFGRRLCHRLFGGWTVSSELPVGRVLGRGQGQVASLVTEPWSLEVSKTGSLVKRNLETGETLELLPREAGADLSLGVAVGPNDRTVVLNANSGRETIYRFEPSNPVNRVLVLSGTGEVLLVPARDDGSAVAVADGVGERVPLPSYVRQDARINFSGLKPVVDWFKGIDWRKWRRWGLRVLAIALLAFAVLYAAGLLIDTGENDGLKWADFVPEGGGRRYLTAAGIAALAMLLFWSTKRDWTRVQVGVAALPAIYLIAAWFALQVNLGSLLNGVPKQEARAQVFALLSVGFALVAAALLLKAKSAPGAPVSLSDVLSNRTSPSSTVLLLWTLIVVYAIAVAGGYHLQENTGSFLCVGTNPVYCIPKDVWAEYLILLGVPGAAAALAKSSNQSSGDQSSRSTNAMSETQYFIFNVLAMAIVLSQLIDRGRLPELPGLVVALTGAAALVYTIDKRTPV